MPDIVKMLGLLSVVFLLLSLLFNIMPKWPLIPGDIYINKSGIKVYIPFASAIVISVLLTLYFNFFK